MCKWKKRGILMPFSDDDGFFSLILHQKLTGVSFLKVSYNVEARTTSLYFSYLIKIKTH